LRSYFVPLLLVFTLLALIVYAAAFGGAMMSDDEHYVASNPYIQELSLENLVAILDPTSIVSQLVENYAPVHLLLHAGAWALFGPAVTGHHVFNVLLHALGCALFSLFLHRSGVGRALSAIAGAALLLHPANVEAVAWISQLKTTSAFVLSLLALLAHPRRPVLGLALFGLALLAKPTAGFAFFVVIALGWVRADERNGNPEPENWHWPVVACWAGVFLAFAIAEFYAFSFSVPHIGLLYPEAEVRLRTTAAIGLRYLVMAASGYGVALFHEPPPAASWLDPWWLGSLLALLAIASRIFVVVRARRMESVFWLWAAASYAPISGAIPLPFPMADRYLYFILPGLVGALCFALPEWSRGLARQLRREAEMRTWQRGGLVAGALLCLVFGAQTVARAGGWGEPNRLLEHSAAIYPSGTVAGVFRVQEAARRGDVVATVQGLRAARIQPNQLVFDLLSDPIYSAIRDDPRFVALVQELAQRVVDQPMSAPSQMQLRMKAHAYMLLGELDEVERTLRAGLELEGPIAEILRADLEDLQRTRAGGF
jgi:hypothetical protein